MGPMAELPGPMTLNSPNFYGKLGGMCIAVLARRGTIAFFRFSKGF